MELEKRGKKLARAFDKWGERRFKILMVLNYGIKLGAHSTRLTAAYCHGTSHETILQGMLQYEEVCSGNV
jgi:hypothetical protein